MTELDSRTHGPESAIDDEPVAIAPNMTEQADEAQIPGAETIPLDMPNSEPGDIRLEYSLQNFNALVAANTALMTEVSSLIEKVALIEAQRDSFAEGLLAERETAAAYLAQIKDLQEHDRKRQKEHGEAIESLQADLQFANDTAATFQRRLDRATGYLDAIFDREDSLRSPSTESRPAPQPEVGPALGQIPDAVRRNKTGRPDMPYAFAGEPLRTYDPARTSPRRY